MKEKELEKTVISIVEELRDGEEITNSRMLAIQNSVRKLLGLSHKKICSTNKQRLVELLRKVLGENLQETIQYGTAYGEGRKPTKFSIKDYEKARKDIERYFSKAEMKKKSLITSQKKTIISKLITILKKVNDTPGNTIERDLLTELIHAKTPISGTLRSWNSVLEKEGIRLLIKSTGRGKSYKVENVEETLTKLESLYERVADEKVVVKKEKETSPLVIKEERKELTEDEEKVLYLLAEICNRKEVPYSNIWANLKRQGITVGFDFNDLIKRSGLKKWFVQTRRVILGGVENQLQFIGDLNAVASLMGQKTTNNRIILFRSSLEPEEIKSVVKNIKLLSYMPNASIYSIEYSDMSVLDLIKIKFSFRGYDGFIDANDKILVDKVVNETLEKISTNL